MNLILTNYFTSKPDPQRGHYWKKNDFSIMETWYNSVMKHNLNAIVFHDELSDEFIEKYENDNIKFKKVNYDTLWSTNDFRFKVFCEFLIENREEYDNVLITDISDVEFLRNPFLHKVGENMILFGKNNFWEEKPKVQERYPYLKNRNFNGLPILHAGTFVGDINILITFLKIVVDMIYICSDMGLFNQNLGIINYIAQNYQKPTILRDFIAIVSSTFTTQLKKYDYNNKDCYIRHK